MNENPSNPLWNELELGKLLDSQPLSIAKDVALSNVEGVPKGKIMKKHREMLEKPGFNVLMGRYNALPHGTPGISTKSIDRLADPIKSRFGYARVASPNMPNYNPYAGVEANYSTKQTQVSLPSITTYDDPRARISMAVLEESKKIQEEAIRKKVYGIVRDILSPNHVNPVDDSMKVKLSEALKRSKRMAVRRPNHPADRKIQQLASKLHVPLKSNITVKRINHDPSLPTVDFRNNLFLGNRYFENAGTVGPAKPKATSSKSLSKVEKSLITERDTSMLEYQIDRDILGVGHVNGGEQVVKSVHAEMTLTHGEKSQPKKLVGGSGGKFGDSANRSGKSSIPRKLDPIQSGTTEVTAQSTDSGFSSVYKKKSRHPHWLDGLEQIDAGTDGTSTGYLKRIHNEVTGSHSSHGHHHVHNRHHVHAHPPQSEVHKVTRSIEQPGHQQPLVRFATSDVDSITAQDSDRSCSSEVVVFDPQLLRHHEQPSHLPWLHGTLSDLQHAYQHAHEKADEAAHAREHFTSEELEERVKTAPSVAELLGHPVRPVHHGTMGLHVVDNITRPREIINEMNTFLCNVAIANSIEQDGWEAHQVGSHHKAGINTIELLQSIPAAMFDGVDLSKFQSSHPSEIEPPAVNGLHHQASIHMNDLDDSVRRRLEILTRRMQSQVLLSEGFMEAESTELVE